MILRAATLALAATLFLSGRTGAQEIRLPLDAPDEGWRNVAIADDGWRGRAARFEGGAASIDAGPCPVSSGRAFTLRCALRTRSGGFATALMARDGDAVGMSLVVGRRPGCISFEAWSWERVRLVSDLRIDDGRWHRIEVAYDPEGTIAALFVDEKLAAWGALGAGASPQAQLRLGDNIGAHQPFEGDLDDVEIEPVLSHAEVLAALRPVLPPKEHAADLSLHRNRLLPKPAGSLRPVRSGFRERADLLRERLADALGLRPEPSRPPFDVLVHGALDGPGFRVERISFASWPGARATAWLWAPSPRPKGRLPAILSPHGHWAGGAIDPVVQARAIRCAQAGYLVLAVDSVHVEDVASGLSSIGVMTWNNLRAVDVLCARDDVDPERLGITGASGGGQQTMFMMALDERLDAAAPVAMISRLETILDVENAHCGCNHPPRVGAIADEPEICALFAPRPVFFGSLSGDWTHEFPEDGLPEIMAVYEAFGAGSALHAWHEHAGHGFSRAMRERVYAFFDRVFFEEPPAARDGAVAPIPPEILRHLGPDPAVPPPDRDALAREHRARRPRFARIAEAAPALPWRVERGSFERSAGGPGAFAAATLRDPDGVRLPGRLRETGKARDAHPPWNLVVPPRGMAGFLAAPPPWLARRDRVAVIDPRFRGEWEPFAGAGRRNGMLLGAGEGYLAAHDVARWAASLPGEGPVTAVGIGDAGVDVLLAALIAPPIRTLVLTDLGPLFEEDGERRPSCPEVLRFGDLPALLAALPGPRRVVLGGLSRAKIPVPPPPIIIEATETPLEDARIDAVLGSR